MPSIAALIVLLITGQILIGRQSVWLPRALAGFLVTLAAFAAGGAILL